MYNIVQLKVIQPAIPSENLSILYSKSLLLKNYLSKLSKLKYQTQTKPE